MAEEGATSLGAPVRKQKVSSYETQEQSLEIIKKEGCFGNVENGSEQTETETGGIDSNRQKTHTYWQTHYNLNLYTISCTVILVILFCRNYERNRGTGLASHASDMG